MGKFCNISCPFKRPGSYIYIVITSDLCEIIIISDTKKKITRGEGRSLKQKIKKGVKEIGLKKT